MFSFRTGLFALPTSRPPMQNKARTHELNEHFLGVNAPATNGHDLEEWYFFYFIFVNNIIISFSYYSVLYVQFSSLVFHEKML